LFVAADGPRSGTPEDVQRCAAARAVFEEVDWDCTVRTLFRDDNLGLKAAMSSAITWFFDHVNAGIILEDDCVPDPSFFHFCGELLNHYSEASHVMTISGNNYQPRPRTRYSYYFSRYMHCWGWATWKSAWQHYDPEMSKWPKIREDDSFGELFETRRAARYWRNIFDRTFSGKIDSWAYIWQYCIWVNGGVNILPEKNLVRNIGFGDYSTHTKNERNNSIEEKSVSLPLRHPGAIIKHSTADEYTQVTHYNPPFHKVLLRKINRLLNP
jgi:hypothetical protein